MVKWTHFQVFRAAVLCICRKTPPWKNDYSAPTEGLQQLCVVLWGVGVNRLTQMTACLLLALHHLLCIRKKEG